MTSEVIEDEKQFYSKAKTYWKEVPPTVDGMLGGYGHISAIDISSSRKFLQRFLRVGRSGVLSGRRGCGAGATSSVSRCRVFGHLPVAATPAWKDGGGVGGCGLWTLPRGYQTGTGGLPGARTESSPLELSSSARDETFALGSRSWTLGCSAAGRLRDTGPQRDPPFPGGHLRGWCRPGPAPFFSPFPSPTGCLPRTPLPGVSPPPPFHLPRFVKTPCSLIPLSYFHCSHFLLHSVL